MQINSNVWSKYYIKFFFSFFLYPTCFYGYACTTLLVLSCDRILGLVCLLILQCNMLDADSFPFAFPRMELKFKFLFSPWPTDLDWLSVLLFSCLPELTLAAVRSAHRELTTVWSVYGWGACTVRSAWAQVDGIQWWGIPSGSLVDFLRNLCLFHIFLEFYLPPYQPLPTPVM